MAQQQQEIERNPCYQPPKLSERNRSPKWLRLYVSPKPMPFRANFALSAPIDKPSTQQGKGCERAKEDHMREIAVRKDMRH